MPVLRQRSLDEELIFDFLLKLYYNNYRQGGMKMNDDRMADFLIISIFIILILLKILNVITISWLWLLSPIWILIGIGLLFALVFVVLVLINLWYNKIRRR